MGPQLTVQQRRGLRDWIIAVVRVETEAHPSIIVLLVRCEPYGAIEPTLDTFLLNHIIGLTPVLPLSSTLSLCVLISVIRLTRCTVHSPPEN